MKRALRLLCTFALVVGGVTAGASAQMQPLANDDAYDLVGKTASGHDETVRISARGFVRDIDTGNGLHDLLVADATGVAHQAPHDRLKPAQGFAADVDLYLAHVISGVQTVDDDSTRSATGEIVTADVKNARLVSLTILSADVNENATVTFSNVRYSSGRIVAWQISAPSLQTPILESFSGALAPYDAGYAWPSSASNASATPRP